MEALQALFEDRCREEADLQAQLSAARLDAQQLRLRLQLASGGKDAASLIPAELRAGGRRGSAANADLGAAEHKSLLTWLADTVDTSRPLAFYAPGDVVVGEHKVTLGRMVQWQLANVPGGLKLSVPKDLEEAFLDLLSRTRKGYLGSSELWGISETWELMGADVASEGQSSPAIFIVQRKTMQAAVVASWPCLEPMPAPAPAVPQMASMAAPSFDPAAHFGFSSGAPQCVMAAAPSLPTIRKVTFGMLTDEQHMICELTPSAFLGDAHAQSSWQCGRGLVWSVAGFGTQVAGEIDVYFDDNDQCTLIGPFGSGVVVDPPKGQQQRDLVRHIVIMATEQGVALRCGEHGAGSQSTETGAASPAPRPEPQQTGHAAVSRTYVAIPVARGLEETIPEQAPSMHVLVATGDHVEVEFEGEWFSGTLQCVQGEVAHVHCDTDDPKVITMAHLSSVRPAPRAAAAQTTSDARNVHGPSHTASAAACNAATHGHRLSHARTAAAAAGGHRRFGGHTRSRTWSEPFTS